MPPRKWKLGAAQKWALNIGNGGPTRLDSLFLKSFYAKKDRNGPVIAKAVLQLSPGS